MLKKLQFADWTLPIALLVIVIISFGLLIPWLGFYWDDWPSIWFLHQLGPAGFVRVFASDRPFLGELFRLTTSLLGESIVAWQVFGLLMRWCVSLAVWWLLSGLWPQQRRQAAWVAILFLIYPGFSQQAISVTYSHAWFILAVFICSLGAMIWAIRKPRWFWPLMAVAWLGSALAMFSTEYFYTLELLRPVLTWLALRDSIPQKKERLKKAIIYWLPFLLLMVFFFIWRVFIHEFPRGQISITTRLAQNPIMTFVQLARTVLSSIFIAGFQAWGLPYQNLTHLDFSLLTSKAALGLTVLSAIFIIVYVAHAPFANRPDKTESGQSGHLGRQNQRIWAIQAILLGVYALLVAGWPFWMTDLPVQLGFPNDRFTLPFMLGSSFLLVGVIEIIPWPQAIRAIALGTLVGTSAGLHFTTANLYRLDWNAQKAFFWQLSWRAPGLKPGTVVMSAELPFHFFSDNSLTAPLNWIYAPDQSPLNMRYVFYDIQSRRGNKPQKLMKGEAIYLLYRAAAFTGSTSQSLVVMYLPPGCVKVFDTAFDLRYPNIPKPVDAAKEISDVGTILLSDQSAQLPKEFFGDEPVHEWCYYFEKAEFYRQMGAWEEIIKLSEKAMRLNTRLSYLNAAEFTPYIEAYAHTGGWTEAQKLSKRAASLATNTRNILCETWRRIEATTPTSEGREETVAAVKEELGCPRP